LRSFLVGLFCFGSIEETPTLTVLVKKQNNQNKPFVLDNIKTSFGSSFGCFESKLVSQDTLHSMFEDTLWNNLP